VSSILVAPRPVSHSRASPINRVEIDTASHHASALAQPKPAQLMSVCTRRVVPPTLAPDATIGSFWETTSPVTFAPLASATRPRKTTTSPFTVPEMATGASKAVSDPFTVPSTVDEP
jgi:hypothetical protein